MRCIWRQGAFRPSALGSNALGISVMRFLAAHLFARAPTPRKALLLAPRTAIILSLTVRKPTDAALRMARGLLDGNTKPPEIIERTRPTSFAEIGKASKLVGPDGKPLQPETTPERILKLQSRYGGIVARLGSWFLYAKNAPQLTSIDQATPI